MKRLTREILDEEAKKYFLKINGSFDVSSLTEGYCEPVYTSVKLNVFPEYSEWIKNKKEKVPSYGGTGKSTGWAMRDYISDVLGLANHLIDNKYPQEAILAMLPRDFSSKIAERLNE